MILTPIPDTISIESDIDFPNIYEESKFILPKAR